MRSGATDRTPWSSSSASNMFGFMNTLVVPVLGLLKANRCCRRASHSRSFSTAQKIASACDPSESSSTAKPLVMRSSLTLASCFSITQSRYVPYVVTLTYVRAGYGYVVPSTVVQVSLYSLVPYITFIRCFNRPSRDFETAFTHRKIECNRHNPAYINLKNKYRRKHQNGIMALWVVWGQCTLYSVVC